MHMAIIKRLFITYIAPMAYWPLVNKNLIYMLTKATIKCISTVRFLCDTSIINHTVIDDTVICDGKVVYV